jgi:hypothetical protein
LKQPRYRADGETHDRNANGYEEFDPMRERSGFHELLPHEFSFVSLTDGSSNVYH